MLLLLELQLKRLWYVFLSTDTGTSCATSRYQFGYFWAVAAALFYIILVPVSTRQSPSV
jgi:hypothetical protein